MSTDKKQSAINEVRDQLFLDTADKARLNVVTSNLGLDRPAIGFDDDHWRAVAKEIMLRSKLVRNVFYRILEICIGPQKTRIGTLSSPASTNDTVITLNDSSDLLQVGELVLSPGLPEEETVKFCFRDLQTNEVFLSTGLANNHNTLIDASSFLTTDYAAGAVSIVVIDSSVFPTTGFPYPITLDTGTDVEEVVLVSSNTIATNTLGISATVNDHAGPKSQFLRKELAIDVLAGRDFFRVGAGDAKYFPATGFVRIDKGGSEEVREYTSIDISTESFFIKIPFSLSHVIGESVELVSSGASVSTVSVQQLGKGWELYETEPKKIKIFLPESLTPRRALDAAYLHDATPSPAATTLDSPTVADDTVLELVSVAGFPESGMVLIDGTLVKSYAGVDDTVAPPTITLAEPIGAAFIATTAVSLYSVPYAGTDLEEGNFRDAFGTVQPNRYAGPYLYDVLQRAPSAISTELATFVPDKTRVAFNQVTGSKTLEVADASTFPAAPFDVIIGRDSGFQEERTVTDVTLKKSATATTALVGGPFGAGSFSVIGALTTGFPESNGVAPANYRIRINAGGLTEEDIRVFQNDTGTGTFSLMTGTVFAHSAGETVTLVNDVVTVDALTQPHAGPAVNPSTLGHLVEVLLDKIDLTSGTNFPTTGGVIYINFGKERLNARSRMTDITAPNMFQLESTDDFPVTDYPYPVVLSKGTAVEEIAYVTGNNTGLSELTFSSPPVNDHESMWRFYATGYITVPVPSAILDGETFVLDDGVNPPTTFEYDVPPNGVGGGNVAIDISSAITPNDVRDASITAINGAAGLSITAYPGGTGIVFLVHDQFGFIGNTLITDTVADPGFIVSGMAGGALIPGPYVEFTAGAPETVTYDSRDGTELEFAIPKLLLSRHTVGERVMLSPSVSIPATDGNDYAFLFPPDPAACVKLLFNLVRAAGVQIEFLSDR